MPKNTGTKYTAMASRITDTELWDEDWFCELSGEYQLFIKYMFDKCDNIGVWKPNKIDFEAKTKFSVNLGSLLEKVNGGKERILVLENGRWFILGFIQFQWFKTKSTFTFNLTNNLHKSLLKLIETNCVPLGKIRGLSEVCQTSINNNTEEILKEKENKVLFKKEVFKGALRVHLDEFGKDVLNAFYRYWGETMKDGVHLKYEMEKSWELRSRLIVWATNASKFSKK